MTSPSPRERGSLYRVVERMGWSLDSVRAMSTMMPLCSSPPGACSDYVTTPLCYITRLSCPNPVTTTTPHRLTLHDNCHYDLRTTLHNTSQSLLITVTMGSIVSAIGSAINAIISAIANVIETIVSAIVTVLVAIWDFIIAILCCRCFSRGGTGTRTGYGSTTGTTTGRRRRFGGGFGRRRAAATY
ncbi:hypothetical protein C8Q73DRAFT_689060 [Cubamyces lactineus]|nr:hypothetical protein C8Q73DRAFT_689060 [Cubamyces lactineus]